MTSAEGVCHGCGRRPGAAEPAPAQPHVEQCRVQRWDGYVMSTFYALAPNGTVVAESRPFRRRRGETGDLTEQAQQAYNDLLAALLAEGWEQVAQASSDSFESFFSRSGSLAASRPPPRPIHVVKSPPAPEVASSTGDPQPPPVTAPPATTPEEAPTPEDGDEPAEQTTRSTRTRADTRKSAPSKKQKSTGTTRKRSTKTTQSSGTKPKRRVVKKQESEEAAPEPLRALSQEDGTSPEPHVARDERPGEPPPAAQPIHLRPARRDAGPDRLPPVPDPDKLVASPSDPFTYLWINADESHGHHVEAVAQLRASKQLPTEEEPTAKDPAVEKHRPWWRPRGR